MKREILGNNSVSQTRKLPLIIEGKEYLWPDQYITGRQLKELSNLNLEVELYLSISDPWKDELITNVDVVDLARPGIEQFFVKQQLEYTINDLAFLSSKQYIKGSEVRKQGNIQDDHQIFLSIKGPWEDELITDQELVDLARPGIEHFYSKPIQTLVQIIVNGRPKSWTEESISYEQVVELAFGQYTENENTAYTVTYAKGPERNPEGTMVKGDKIFVKDKMVFNVTATNRS